MSGTRPGEAVLARQHGKLRLPLAHRVHRGLERLARQRGHVRIGDAAGEVGIGAGHALEGDRAGHARPAGASSRGAPVPGPPAYRRRTAPCSMRAQAIRMPASSARSCSRLLPPLQRCRRQRDVARQRGAAVGVDADMMPARAVAPRDRLRARNTAPARPLRPRSNAQAAFTNDAVFASSSDAIGTTSVPMSQAGIAPAASAPCADCAPVMVGKSPCRFTTTSCRPSGSSSASAACTRSEPRRQRRDRSAPRCRRRRARHRRSPHRRRPPPPARYPPRAPRSSTCTIIGRPWMSASGLPGSRVEAMRAGMMTIGFTG